MGTLLLDKNLVYWYSELKWHNPNYGKDSQPAKFEYLGSPGFAITQENHNRREEIFKMFGDNIPQYPMEWAEIA